jgi:sporulation protein YlmC with PRC-barrel domain
MAHYGTLETQPVSDDVQDIRGTTVRDWDGKKLGKVDDVIFDHDTMEIRHVVVDSDGWLEAGSFLLPADRVFAAENDDNGLATEVTREQIEDSPQYDNNGAIGRRMEEVRAGVQEILGRASGDAHEGLRPNHHAAGRARSRWGEVNPRRQPRVRFVRWSSQTLPERISDVFSDPAPGAGKVTLRPNSVARVEKAASGVSMLKPHWWEAFENYLQLNKSDLQAKCSQCSSKAA